MPSPFPGMDPFIEMFEWEDFHHCVVGVLREHLTPHLGNRYVGRVGRRGYRERRGSEPGERRESYLMIKEVATREVVTVAEFVSPTNKQPGSDGRRLYTAHREAILRSNAHLVEFDLLRGGERLPTWNAVPSGDYVVVVSRSEQRPRCSAYAWPMTSRLPEVAIPLRSPGEDVRVDLQAVHDTVYDRAMYELSIDYTADLVPPPTQEQAAWIARDLHAQN